MPDGILQSHKGACKVNLYTSETLKKIKNINQATEDAVLITVHEKGIEIVVKQHNVEQVRRSLSEGRNLTIMHPDGSEVTHHTNNISVRAFTAEESSFLEKALTNYFIAVLAERKKVQDGKAKGLESEIVRNHPDVPSTKIKDHKTIPAFKNTMDPEFPNKAVKAVLAELLLISSLRFQKREEETIKKEDKIKDQELKRSETRQEIKKDSVKKQSEQIDQVGKEDKKFRIKKEHLSKAKRG